ncbi:histone chaperone domain CHZ-domain-containing protein [Xylariaceae sp. FL0804]|nr:histone chaperone domain CHZ-domain-containing protein [Xylariaceae sp. FL0804]
MSTENGTTLPQDPAAASAPVESKGKGKAVATEEPVDQSMDEDDDEDDEDEEEEEEGGEAAEEEDDGEDEIDPSNIIDSGRRTRGRVIDWAKAAEENPAADEDDDDEDDFEPGNEDKMDED